MTKPSSNGPATCPSRPASPSPHYEHTEIGYNYRMSNIVAAIGLGQLECLDDRVRRKREIFDLLPGGSGGLARNDLYARGALWYDLTAG